MSRLYGQAAPIVLQYSGSIAGGASISGSAICRGYTTLIGGLFSAGSTAASGFKVEQSFNNGSNWDVVTASNSVSSGASAACATALIGDAVRVTFTAGATNSSALRAVFYLKPV